MKAKSKVLLGLLVALAMMVFAVPAFAQAWGVSAADPATQEVYAGDEATYSFTITDPNGADATKDTYTVEFTDSAGTKFTKGDFTTTFEKTGTTTMKVTVKVETENGDVGDHTVKATVKKPSESITSENQAEAKITVKEMPTATLSGDNNGNVAVATGSPIGLSITGYTPDTQNVKYEWQITKKAGTVDDETEWEPIPDAIGGELTAKAKDDMDGKYVRCQVTIDGKNVIAKSGDIENILLAVTNEKEVSVKLKERTAEGDAAQASYTYYIGTETADTTPIYVDATGGPAGGEYEFTWTKDGKAEDVATYATLSQDSKTLTLKDINEKSAGTYKVTVKNGAAEGSAEFKVETKKTPTLKIDGAVGEAAAYINPKDQAEGEGVINVKAEDMNKALTLTAVTTEMTPTYYQWEKDEVAVPQVTGDKFAIKAGDLANGQTYTVTVGFTEAGDESLATATYTVTITEVSGTLEGGLLTSTDGAVTYTLNRPFVITLPEGKDFTVDEQKEGLAKYGVVISGVGKGLDDEDEGLGVENVKHVAPDADAKKGASLSFNYKKAVNADAALEAPVVGPMEATVTIGAGDEAETITLPVDENIGFKITVPVTENELAMTKPDPKTVEYNGSAVEAEVKAQDEEGKAVEGVGDITVKYAKFTGEGPTEDELKKATTTAPTEPGKYAVVCDVTEGTQYGGNDGIVVDRFEIEGINLNNQDNAEKNFTMAPKQVEYNGKTQEPTVEIASNLEKVGTVKELKYKAYGADGTAPAADAEFMAGKPLNIGKYDVYVTTEKTEADTNVKTPATEVRVGVFEITKTLPTAELYKMSPAEVTYTGAEQGTNVTKANEKAGDVDKVLYYAEGSDEPLEGLPVNAGVYTVTIETKESADYAAATGEDALELGTFTIKEEKSDEQPTIYINPHVENIGWAKESSELEAGESIDAGTTGQGLRVEAVAFIVPEDYKVVGFAHVQNEGDVDVKKVESSSDYDIPEGYVAYEFGSTGKGQRVEAVCIGLQDADGEYVKGFQYATHLQNYGWQGYVRNGSFSGTRGMGLRMESIRFTYADPDVVKPGEPSGSLLK